MDLFARPRRLDSAPGVPLPESTLPSRPRPRLPGPIGLPSKTPAAPRPPIASTLNPDSPVFRSSHPRSSSLRAAPPPVVSPVDPPSSASSTNTARPSQPAPDNEPSTPPLADCDTAFWTALGDHQLASSDSLVVTWPPSAADSSHDGGDLIHVANLKQQLPPLGALPPSNSTRWMPSLTSTMSADAQAYDMMTHHRRYSLDSDLSRCDSLSSNNSQHESAKRPVHPHPQTTTNIQVCPWPPQVQRADQSTLPMPVAWVPLPPPVDKSAGEEFTYARSLSRRESAPPNFFNMAPPQAHFFHPMSNVNGALVACYPVAFESPAGTPILMDSFSRPIAQRSSLSGPAFTLDEASSRIVLEGMPGPSPNNKKTNLYKTELCRSWEEKGSCRYGSKCQFAHGHDEMRNITRHPKFKTEICRTFCMSGACPYGKRCCFLHTSLKDGMMSPVIVSTSTKSANLVDPPDAITSRFEVRTGTNPAGDSPTTSPNEPSSSLFGASVTSYLNAGQSPPRLGASKSLIGQPTTQATLIPSTPNPGQERGSPITSSPSLSSTSSSCKTIGGGGGDGGFENHHIMTGGGMNGFRVTMGPKFANRNNRDQVPRQDAPGPRSRLERLKRVTPTSEVPPPLLPPLLASVVQKTNVILGNGPKTAPVVFTNPFDSAVKEGIETGPPPPSTTTIQQKFSSSYFPDFVSSSSSSPSPTKCSHTNKLELDTPHFHSSRSPLTQTNQSLNPPLYDTFSPLLRNGTTATTAAGMTIPRNGSGLGLGIGIWASSLTLPFDIQRHYPTKEISTFTSLYNSSSISGSSSNSSKNNNIMTT